MEILGEGEMPVSLVTQQKTRDASAMSQEGDRSGFVEAKSNSEIAPCLSVVMPVYNEQSTVAPIARTVLEQRPVQELIIVDDCSSDKTAEALGNLTDKRIRLLRHDRNQGKGAALRTGFQQAKARVVIVQDADLEYNPAEYYLVLNPILAGKADVVFGSRFVGAGLRRV